MFLMKYTSGKENNDKEGVKGVRKRGYDKGGRGGRRRKKRG